MTLRPNKTIHKALLSTTSRLVGEYESDGVLLTHAWPDFYDRNASARFSEGPVSRSAFVLAFKTELIEKKVGPIPNYSPTGEMICTYLAVLFGKRFDYHGLVESNGYFHIPELSQFSNLCKSGLPHNSHAPRIDFSVPLNLTEVGRIERLFHDSTLDTKFQRTFQGAAKFYLQAIQNAEYDPEVAYLHLITAGEILSNFHEYDKNMLLDNPTKLMLSTIRETAANGDKIAKNFEGKLFLIKKRFTQTILTLVDQNFFKHSEAKENWSGFQAKSFSACISAAYDLRSKYVHTGISFGNWTSMNHGGMNNETQIGKPIVDDKKFGAIIAKAPTFIGLERVMRYCLLKFAKLHGAYVEPIYSAERDCQPNINLVDIVR